jgi:hypothetical protein
LVEKFPNKWIGRNGPMPWPPRSPDLTVLDLFFWGYIKDMVCAEKIRDLQHLNDRICAAIETVMPEMLSCVWEEAEHRLDICRVTNGAHIEIYEMSYIPCEILVFFL